MTVSVMDFLAMPPELTSALVHTGPGAGSMIEASNAWQRLGTELDTSATTYTSVVSSLIEAWDGPSSSAMVQAVQPYITWLRATAQQSQQMASATQAAAMAFNAAHSAVVPPAAVGANRTRLAQLVATNRFGSNLPAIAATEEAYQGMWTNNSAALSRYEAAVAQALDLKQFSTPPAIANPAAAAEATAASATGVAAPAQSIGDFLESIVGTPLGFDPNIGWFGLANTYANQFISSGFPINLLSLEAQLATAQGIQQVGGDVGQGLSEGEAALGVSTADLANAVKAVGSAAPTAAVGVGVSLGKLTAPPAVVGLLPASQSQVQLASAATPLDGADAGFPMLPPLMPPPISAGSGWRKRKQPKLEEYGSQVKGKVIHTPPSAG